MKKRAIIIPAVILAVATPTAIYAAKRLDTSSTAPVIKSSAENWSKTATISVTNAATFGGSALDYYEYCVSDTTDIESCDWKVSTVETIHVRNLGTSYVWMRGISKYGVVSGISDYVLTKVDRNKPTASAENTTTTASITATVEASDDSDIKSYEYSIDGSDYVTDGASHTFTGLNSGTSYSIKIRVTDLAGNTKILSYAQSTVNPVVTRIARASGNNRSFSGTSNGYEKSSTHPNSSRTPGRGEKLPAEDDDMKPTEEKPEKNDDAATDAAEPITDTDESSEPDDEAAADTESDADTIDNSENCGAPDKNDDIEPSDSESLENEPSEETTTCQNPDIPKDEENNSGDVTNQNTAECQKQDKDESVEPEDNTSNPTQQSEELPIQEEQKPAMPDISAKPEQA